MVNEANYSNITHPKNSNIKKFLDYFINHEGEEIDANRLHKATGIKKSTIYVYFQRFNGKKIKKIRRGTYTSLSSAETPKEELFKEVFKHAEKEFHGVCLTANLDTDLLDGKVKSPISNLLNSAQKDGFGVDFDSLIPCCGYSFAGNKHQWCTEFKGRRITVQIAPSLSSVEIHFGCSDNPIPYLELPSYLALVEFLTGLDFHKSAKKWKIRFGLAKDLRGFQLNPTEITLRDMYGNVFRMYNNTSTTVRTEVHAVNNPLDMLFGYLDGTYPVGLGELKDEVKQFYRGMKIFDNAIRRFEERLDKFLLSNSDLKKCVKLLNCKIDELNSRIDKIGGVKKL